ncbi:unnamed protein product [Caenorhabditis angaria]|uniref:PAN-3 domain-containing protein n=1 Tax=Caenorhabditis angaria TaxID=860376 RepID=A0A9P1IE31_9PELO|nr:unnamed protein product [Caenorhabditis angaria]
MLFSIFLLLFFMQTVFSTMLIFYGTPGASIDCTSASTTSWDSCIDNCEANSTCFLAYSSPQISCYYCGYGQFPDITYSTDEITYTLALKTDNSTVCKPEFLEYLEANNFDPLKLCPSPWLRVIRNDTVLCGVQIASTTPYTEKLASDYCLNNLVDSVLIGFADQAETDLWVIPNNKARVNQSMLLALRRNDAGGDFLWTDPWITATWDIDWDVGHPKSGYNCASMQFTTGLIQSENCTSTACSNSRCCYAALCGQLMK